MPVHFGAMYKFAMVLAVLLAFRSLDCRHLYAVFRITSLWIRPWRRPRQVLCRPRLPTLQQAISVLTPFWASESVGAISVHYDSLNTNPINGVNLIDPEQHRIWHRDRQQRRYGRCQVYVGPVQVFLPATSTFWQNNPKNPLGVGASDQGGYFMSGVEDKNLDSEKLVQIWWTGVKYTYRSKTDFTFAWYQQRQNDFRIPPPASPQLFPQFLRGHPQRGISVCGSIDFTKRFDRFYGIAYSYERRLAWPFSSWPRVPID